MNICSKNRSYSVFIICGQRSRLNTTFNLTHNYKVYRIKVVELPMNFKMIYKQVFCGKKTAHELQNDIQTSVPWQKTAHELQNDIQTSVLWQKKN